MTTIEYASQKTLAMQPSRLGNNVGSTEGKVNEAQALILRQLQRRVGNVSIDLEAQTKTLPLAQLEDLGEALLDFSRMSDLVAWLDVDRSQD